LIHIIYKEKKKNVTSGLGPFIAAGPIMAAIAGVCAGGLVGGIAGALIGMGIPEYEANRMKGGSRKEEYYFLFTPTIETGRIKRKRFWNVQARKI
jgi:hypothetical protein